APVKDEYVVGDAAVSNEVKPSGPEIAKNAAPVRADASPAEIMAWFQGLVEEYERTGDPTLISQLDAAEKALLAVTPPPLEGQPPSPEFQQAYDLSGRKIMALAINRQIAPEAKQKGYSPPGDLITAYLAGIEAQAAGRKRPPKGID